MMVHHTCTRPVCATTFESASQGSIHGSKRWQTA